jgi:hypothetical protein
MKQFIISFFVLLNASIIAQNAPVRFAENPQEQKVDVFINDTFFTAFLYADSLKKQVLYPIFTASGKTITRGYPIHPQAGESTDHPHQVGAWLNFGDVEGLDFWNHSFAIPVSERCKYGTIRYKGIVEKDATNGRLVAQAEWVDCQNGVLLEETTTYTFAGKPQYRSIIRKSVLKAVNRDIQFTENKEGFFGLRMDQNFEETGSGIYTNMAGVKGGNVWGKRSPWVVLSGQKEGEDISIVIFDHPQNVNYPGWWHARGYGLFAINNLGGRTFDEKSEPVKLVLKKGESLTFIYKVLIKNGSFITDNEINQEMF